MKKIVNILYGLIMPAIIVGLMSSCQDATISPYYQPVKPIIINDYPIEIGNYWKYYIEYSNSNKKDTVLITIISKVTKYVFDTTVTEYKYTEKIYNENYSDLSSDYGKIFNYKNIIFNTENKLNRDRSRFVRTIFPTMNIGDSWVDTIAYNGNVQTIAEMRKISKKIDLTIDKYIFKNCYAISKYWIYYTPNRTDTIKVGTEVFCPSVGIIYVEKSVGEEVYEKRYISDYMIVLRQ